MNADQRGHAVNAEDAIREAINRYPACMDIVLDPAYSEIERAKHSGYAHHYSTVVVFLRALQQENPEAADRVADWFSQQDGISLNDWMTERALEIGSAGEDTP